jgi:hypothetical protein
MARPGQKFEPPDIPLISPEPIWAANCAIFALRSRAGRVAPRIDRWVRLSWRPTPDFRPKSKDNRPPPLAVQSAMRRPPRSTRRVGSALESHAAHRGCLRERRAGCRASARSENPICTPAARISADSRLESHSSFNAAMAAGLPSAHAADMDNRQGISNDDMENSSRRKSNATRSSPRSRVPVRWRLRTLENGCSRRWAMPDCSAAAIARAKGTSSRRKLVNLRLDQRRLTAMGVVVPVRPALGLEGCSQGDDRNPNPFTISSSTRSLKNRRRFAITCTAT